MSSQSGYPYPIYSDSYFKREDSTTLAKPTWRLGTVTTAPAAGAALVTIAAVSGQKHRCFGILFGKEDIAGNLIQIRDGASIKCGFSGNTGKSMVSPVPIVVGTANTAMTANNLNAGAAGIDYWCALLVETA